MNIEKLLAWSDEEWDALQDAVATTAGFRAGHVITDDDMKAMELVRHYEDDVEEQDRDQYGKGVEAGRTEAVGEEVAALLAKIDELQGEIIVEKAMAKVRYMLDMGRPEIASAPQTAAERDTLREEFKALYRSYVRLIEAGRDRITDLGGACDSVQSMEENDPALIRARAIINQGQAK